MTWSRTLWSKAHWSETCRKNERVLCRTVSPHLPLGSAVLFYLYSPEQSSWRQLCFRAEWCRRLHPPLPHLWTAEVKRPLNQTMFKTIPVSAVTVMQPIHTIIRLKQLTWCCIEIFQFEVTGSFQRHTKALSVPPPPPQNVLWKSSRSSTHVTEVQKLAYAVFCQAILHKQI